MSVRYRSDEPSVAIESQKKTVAALIKLGGFFQGRVEETTCSCCLFFTNRANSLSLKGVPNVPLVI